MNTDCPIPKSAKEVWRILFIFDNLELSGADKVALDLVRLTAGESQSGVRARGFVCMADKTAHACADDDIEFANPGLDPATPIWKKPFLGLKAVLCCVRAARNVDLVVGVTPPASFVAACVGLLAAKPAVAWVHYDLNGWSRELDSYSRGLAARLFEVLFYRHTVPRFENIVFASTSTLESMAGSRNSIPRHWAHIPYPFSPRPFAHSMPDVSEMARLKANGGPLLILLGRLTRQKRWGDAIRALELTTSAGPAPHLVVIGDGNERAEFLACASASPAAARIHWLGAMANPFPALAMGDALVLTSLYEAWPVVILEAFHARVPVVAYDCPSGPSEMLADGRGLCCPESPAAMAKSIEVLLSLPVAERTKMLDLAEGFLTRHNSHEIMAKWRRYAEGLAAPS